MIWRIKKYLNIKINFESYKSHVKILIFWSLIKVMVQLWLIPRIIMNLFTRIFQIQQKSRNLMQILPLLGWVLYNPMIKWYMIEMKFLNKSIKKSYRKKCRSSYRSFITQLYRVVWKSTKFSSNNRHSWSHKLKCWKIYYKTTRSSHVKWILTEKHFWCSWTYHKETQRTTKKWRVCNDFIRCSFTN